MSRRTYNWNGEGVFRVIVETDLPGVGLRAEAYGPYSTLSAARACATRLRIDARRGRRSVPVAVRVDGVYDLSWKEIPR